MSNGNSDPQAIHIDAMTLERMLRRRDDGVNQMLREQLESCQECRQTALDLYERYRSGELGELPGAELLAGLE